MRFPSWRRKGNQTAITALSRYRVRKRRPYEKTASSPRPGAVPVFPVEPGDTSFSYIEGTLVCVNSTSRQPSFSIYSPLLVLFVRQYRGPRYSVTPAPFFPPPRGRRQTTHLRPFLSSLFHFAELPDFSRRGVAKAPDRSYCPTMKKIVVIAISTFCFGNLCALREGAL